MPQMYVFSIHEEHLSPQHEIHSMKEYKQKIKEKRKTMKMLKILCEKKTSAVHHFFYLIILVSFPFCFLVELTELRGGRIAV